AVGGAGGGRGGRGLGGHRVTPRRVLGWRSPAAARGGGRRGGGVRRCGRTRRGGPGSRWGRAAGRPRGGAPGCPTAEVTRVREAGSGVGHPGGGRGARPAGTGVAGSCRVRGVTGDRVRRGAGPGGRTSSWRARTPRTGPCRSRTRTS